jgi:hypothetical protein
MATLRAYQNANFNPRFIATMLGSCWPFYFSTTAIAQKITFTYNYVGPLDAPCQYSQMRIGNSLTALGGHVVTIVTVNTLPAL